MTNWQDRETLRKMYENYNFWLTTLAELKSVFTQDETEATRFLRTMKRNIRRKSREGVDELTHGVYYREGDGDSWWEFMVVERDKAEELFWQAQERPWGEHDCTGRPFVSWYKSCVMPSGLYKVAMQVCLDV